MTYQGKTFATLAAAALISLSTAAQVADYGPSDGVLSFEDSTAPAAAVKCSRISISTDHAKLGTHSLLWQWNRNNSAIRIPGTIPYLRENPNPKEKSVSTFVFWVYSDCKMEGSLHFSFRKDGRECCWFDYGMGFEGWRGAWVAFDRDMKGRPEEGMDEIIITSPEGVRKGRLWFDCVITSSFQDVRHHSPDWQAPFINEKTTIHWLVLNKSWQLKLDVQPKEALTDTDKSDMKTITDRFIKLTDTGKKPWDIEKIREVYKSYDIRFNKNGSIKGKPIWFTRFGETFINLGIKDASKTFRKNGQLLRQYNDNLFQIARSYRACNDKEIKKELAEIYVTMTKHLLDQGFAAGSALGTIHHLGYSMRNFYTAPVLMKDVLRQAGLSEQMQQAMEWFSGVGEVKTAPKEPGMDIDAFNTSLMGRVASLLMLEDTPYKLAYLQALSRWVDNGFKYVSGTKPCFKNDGTIYHHRKCYPAYAVGGLDGAVNAVWMFRGTGLAISQESHEILKESLLAMRFYCNTRSFPLAMSGRHPDGKGSLDLRHYSLLADSGSPDGKKEIDKELAQAYLRLAGSDIKTSLAAKLVNKHGFKPEQTPQGSRWFPFNCSLSHRTGETLVTIAGHSRYLWAAEIYRGANHYGRYLTHGSMQILGAGTPCENGFQVAGWDWCHIPGTTAAEIPMEQMKANVLNVDEFSGYEEMLLSDEWFAGGVTCKDTYGLYAMKLHEHDKYNGSLRANKSFFAFDNRIVALGSDLRNELSGSNLHTTLFQNLICEQTPTTINGQSINQMDYSSEDYSEQTVLKDCHGNAYIVTDALVHVDRGLQHSLHEETDVPTEGLFEKAYICHGGIVGPSICGDVFMKDKYEYLTLIQPTDDEISKYSTDKPYVIFRQDKHAHIVKDIPSGVTGCAVFTSGEVDSLIITSTPALMLYKLDNAGNKMTLSVSNPDLALYKGESDEKFDKNGKRIERSVYSRDWCNNPCSETFVKMTIEGLWEIEEIGDTNVEIAHNDCSTTLVFKTKEARTEEIILKRIEL